MHARTRATALLVRGRVTQAAQAQSQGDCVQLPRRTGVQVEGIRHLCTAED